MKPVRFLRVRSRALDQSTCVACVDEERNDDGLYTQEDERFTKTLAYDPWLFPLGDELTATRSLTRTPLCVVNSTGWNPKHRRPTPGDNEQRLAVLIASRAAAGAYTRMAEVQGTSHMSHSDPPQVWAPLLRRCAVVAGA